MVSIFNGWHVVVLHGVPAHCTTFTLNIRSYQICQVLAAELSEKPCSAVVVEYVSKLLQLSVVPGT